MKILLTCLLPAASIFGPGLAACWALARVSARESTRGRVQSLDGLRGVLALGVLVHHGAIWHDHLRSGAWVPPTAHFLVNCGQASVIFFFMITGYLFVSKILDERTRPVDWLRLYISRGLRLVPMYAATMFLVGVTVAVFSGFRLSDHPGVLAKNGVKWLLFSIPGNPDLNGVAHSSYIVAAVIWTLQYEWLFYGILPVISLATRNATSWLWVALSVAVTFEIARMINPVAILMVPFFSGALVAWLHRKKLIYQLASGPTWATVASALIMAVLFTFPTAYRPAPIILLTIVFCIIASGNPIFGILHRRTLQYLGQLTYSVYLLHGVFLFWLFRLVIGIDRSSTFSWTTHWLAIAAMTPFLVLASATTFRYIEQPTLRRVDAIHQLVAARLKRLRRAFPSRLKSGQSAQPPS